MSNGGRSRRFQLHERICKESLRFIVRPANYGTLLPIKCMRHIADEHLSVYQLSERKSQFRIDEFITHLEAVFRSNIKPILTKTTRLEPAIRLQLHFNDALG